MPILYSLMAGSTVSYWFSLSSPHHVSIKLAISGSFKTAGQSTMTIFISHFHTGIQISSLFWPHAYFSSKSSVQHLVALPAHAALLSSSSYHVCTETHPLPSSWNGHTLLVFLLSTSAQPSISASLISPPKTLSTFCAISLVPLQLKWKTAYTTK